MDKINGTYQSTPPPISMMPFLLLHTFIIALGRKGKKLFHFILSEIVRGQQIYGITRSYICYADHI